MSTLKAPHAVSKLDLVQLRPVGEEDVPMLYQWALTPAAAKTWKYRGATPPPDVFRRDLWSGVLAQYLVTSRLGGEPVALASVYNANMSSKRAHMACLAAPDQVGGGLALLGAVALAAHAFETWPFEKLYFETTSLALEQFSSVMSSGLVSEEARLVDYERFGEDRADLIYLSMEKERLLQRLGEAGAERPLDPRSTAHDPNLIEFDGLRITSDAEVFA